MIDAVINCSVENDKERKILRDPLFDAVLRFNLFPSEYVHPSWIEMVDNALPRVFSPVSRTNAFESRCLSRALLSLCAAEDDFDFDFSDHGKRIALLPHDALISLGMHVIAVLAQSQLREAVMRTQIHAINRAIGEDVRIFGLRWQIEGNRMPPALSELSKMVSTHLSDAGRSHWCAVRLIRALVPANAVAVARRIALKQPVRLRSITPFDLHSEQRDELSALFITVLKNKWPELFQQLWSDTGELHAGNHAH